MNKPSMIRVHCDGCGDEMVVNKEAFMHPRCVLALCDLCVIKSSNEEEEIDDYTPHHVVGINARHC